MKYCLTCGRTTTDETAAICPSCGTSSIASAAPEPTVPTSSETPAPPAPYPPYQALPQVPYPYLVAPPPAPYPPYWGPPPPTPYPYQVPPKPPTRSSGLGRPAMIAIVALAVAVFLVVTGSVAVLSFGLAHGAGIPGGISLPTATPTTGEVLAYQNSLTSNDIGWSGGKSCALKSDGYHVRDSECLSPTTAQYDFDASVKVKQVSGPLANGFGIAFRDQNLGHFYYFMVSATGQWNLAFCNGAPSYSSPLVCSYLVSPQASPVINAGLNASNTLRVLAKGANFEFFVNGTLVGGHDDATYASGGIGVVADQQVDAVFTDFVVYTVV